MTVSHWNGERWTNGESLIPQGARFQQIAMRSARSGWAIGYVGSPSYAARPAIFHWDGMRWSTVAGG